MGSDGTTTKQKKRAAIQSRGKSVYYLVTRLKEGDDNYVEFYARRKIARKTYISYVVSFKENGVLHQHSISAGTVSQPGTIKHGETYKGGKFDAHYTIISGPHDPSASSVAAAPAAPAPAAPSDPVGGRL